MESGNKSFWFGFFAGTTLSLLFAMLVLTYILVHLMRGQGLPVLPASVGAQPAAGHAPKAGPVDPASIKKESKAGVSPSKGSEAAPVTIQEFADFHCGFCKKAAPTMQQILQNYPGKVRLVFHHHPLSTTPGEGSYLTHEAAVCAQEQGKFWEFHDAVFALSDSPREADLHQIASQIRLNANQFSRCLKSGKARKFLDGELAEAKNKGIDGTPTFYVNEQKVDGAYPYEHFVQLIEGILNPGSAAAMAAGKAEAVPAQPAVPFPPPIVKFDDLEGKPSLGAKNAPVTIVEFSDFHCPFCQKVTPTIEQLMKNYEGKIRRVWRHYPLAMHAGAERTHEASQCAAEQNKFWEYHDKLFETLGGARDDQALTQLAKDTKLDEKKFDKCLTSGKYKDFIQKEIEKGNASGVRGTPAFFVNGQLVSGAQPYEKFEQIVKSELAKNK